MQIIYKNIQEYKKRTDEKANFFAFFLNHQKSQKAHSGIANGRHCKKQQDKDFHPYPAI